MKKTDEYSVDNLVIGFGMSAIPIIRELEISGEDFKVLSKENSTSLHVCDFAELDDVILDLDGANVKFRPIRVEFTKLYPFRIHLFCMSVILETWTSCFSMAPALLSIHCRLSMCAFRICRIKTMRKDKEIFGSAF